MQSKQIGTIFNLSPVNRTRKSISETNAARTSACMLLFPATARPTRARGRFASTLVFSDSQFFRQNGSCRGQQDVQSREFRYGSERSVRRGQCVVSPAELGRNPRKHMNAEGRNHHHRNYSEVQKHDYGLAPGVLPKAPLRSKPSTDQQTYPMAISRRELHWRRAERPFQGKLLSTDCLHADYRLRSVRC